MLVMPRGLIVARSMRFKPEVAAGDAAGLLGGVVQRPFLSGGPVWRAKFDDFWLQGAAAIKAALALDTALQGGRAILIRPLDCRQAPGAGALAEEPDPGASPFDVRGSETGPVTATLAAAALRAATVTITHDAARPLVPGDRFGVDCPTWGPRCHLITRVNSVADGVTEVAIRPLLREAIEEGAAADFNRPGVLMFCETWDIRKTDNPLLMVGSASFCELMRPPLEVEL